MAHTDRIFGAEFAPFNDNQEAGYLLATAAADGLVKVWQFKDEEHISVTRTYAGHKDEALRVAWHPSRTGLLTSGGAEGGVFLWDATSEDRLPKRQLLSVSDQIYALAVSSSPGCSDCIIVGYDNQLDVVDLETGQVVDKSTFGPLPLPASTISTKTRRATSSPALGGPRNPDNKPFVFDCDIAPVSGKQELVAIALSDGSARVQDLRTTNAQPIACLQGHTQYATSCKFVNQSGNSYLFSCSGDGSIVSWDPRTWKALASFQAHSRPCFGVCGLSKNSNSGNMLASWSADGSVRCWNFRDILQSSPGEGHIDDLDCAGIVSAESPVFACPITPDGKYMASCAATSHANAQNTSHGHSHSQGSHTGCSHSQSGHSHVHANPEGETVDINQQHSTSDESQGDRGSCGNQSHAPHSHSEESHISTGDALPNQFWKPLRVDSLCLQE